VSNLPFKNFVIPIHREGWYFALAAAAITFILTLIHPNLGWVGAVITAWVVYFFRDPERVTPVREGLVISPADGMILSIGQVDPPKELALGEGPWTKISIFLNIFDVHINRIPIDGEIITSHYRPGLFLNASLSIQTKGGVLIGFVQIAGLIARRIRCDVKEGDKVKAGARFGLIRFGSRADIYLPHGVAPLVIEGQRMIAGETVLADLKSKETARVGEMR
jgi:phosphatidylserine decarboxylase